MCWHRFTRAPSACTMSCNGESWRRCIWLCAMMVSWLPAWRVGWFHVNQCGNRCFSPAYLWGQWTWHCRVSLPDGKFAGDTKIEKLKDENHNETLSHSGVVYEEFVILLFGPVRQSAQIHSGLRSVHRLQRFSTVAAGLQWHFQRPSGEGFGGWSGWGTGVESSRCSVYLTQGAPIIPNSSISNVSISSSTIPVIPGVLAAFHAITYIHRLTPLKVWPQFLSCFQAIMRTPEPPRHLRRQRQQRPTGRRKDDGQMETDGRSWKRASWSCRIFIYCWILQMMRGGLAGLLQELKFCREQQALISTMQRNQKSRINKSNKFMFSFPPSPMLFRNGTLPSQDERFKGSQANVLVETCARSEYQNLRTAETWMDVGWWLVEGGEGVQLMQKFGGSWKGN